MSDEAFSKLVLDLAALDNETEWVEFKVNNDNPDEIGEYLSALSNSAALLNKPRAYLVWGIADESHEVAGSDFRPRSAKVGNEEMENWLRRLLSPRIDFQILEGDINGKRVVVFEIPPASTLPIQFKKQRFIRVGSYKKYLIDCPEKERSLWKAILKDERNPLAASLRLDVDEPERFSKSPTLPGYTGEYRFSLSILNSGQSSADAVTGIITLPPSESIYVNIGGSATWIEYEQVPHGKKKEQKISFMLKPTVSIHKGATLRIIDLLLNFHDGWRKHSISEPVIRWELHAADMEPQLGAYMLSDTMKGVILASSVPR